MNTSQIKNFATQSRNLLKAGVMQRIQVLGFDADGNPTKGEPSRIDIRGGATLFGGEVYDGAFYDRWMSLRHRIEERGVKEVYEEAAYTWFNRLMAIRIMQKNGFIDPVLAYTNEQTRIPQIVAEARAGRVGQMSLADREKLRELMSDDARINEQFALLIDNFCSNNAVIFNCFGGIEEYISLLLPNNILAPGGFIDLLNHTDYITDDDYKQSELIGWLYQFYISEKKDEVFEGFKKGKKAEAEDIPAATQIFTPNWIVKYMVQNTIGRIYLDNNPWATGIKDSMKYLVEPAEPTPQEAILKLECLEDYKLMDNACGSGHILVEAFSLFYKMYLEEGYSSHNAIENILRKNLLGIDLDTRAKQLATFALLMTAAKIDPSFLNCEVMPRVLDMPGHGFSQPLRALLREFYMGEDRIVIEETAKAFELLEQADNLGSIMKFDLSAKTRREMALRYKEWEELSYKNNALSSSAITELLPSISLILALTNKYSAIVTNPPYMNSSNMNAVLSSYVDKHYKVGKVDLFSVFMLVGRSLCEEKGKYALINLPSWLFISSFEKLRNWILSEQHIDSMLHMGRGIFGIDWGSVSFVVTNEVFSTPGVFFRLHKRNFQHIYYQHIGQLFELLNSNHGFKFDFESYRDDDVVGVNQYEFKFYPDGEQLYHLRKQSDFIALPGNPLAYWVGDSIRKIFTENRPLSAVASPCVGLQTADNGRFLRFWFEPSPTRIGFRMKSSREAQASRKKWFPYNKGGQFRRWYGNQFYVVNWENDGEEIKQFKGAVVRNPDFYFKPSISWSLTSANGTGFRYNPDAAIFDVNGMSLFPFEDDFFYILGSVNSSMNARLANLINPTLALQCGDVARLPFLNIIDDSIKTLVRDLAKTCYSISKLDWDVHETSCEFKENEVIRIYKENHVEGVFMDANRLRDIIALYKEYWTEQFVQLHDDEEELNRLFVEYYDLQDEISSVVPLDEITILQQGEISVEDETLVWHDDVLAKQLLSYAIGCMMGRYRLDRPGLHIAYPNPSAADIEAYDFQDEKFEIDDDGIIPLLSRDCPFEDNAYNRLVKFVRQVFGENLLNENLNFIEASLGKSIEDYFVKDFWKDHKKMYSNRPIYWLFSSKKGAFQCLAYMHRMTPYTAEKVRSNYLLRYIDFLKGKIAADLERASSLSTAERRNLDKMQKALDECLEYEELLHDVADRQIRFDLDDGVVVNYAKFGDVVAKIK